MTSASRLPGSSPPEYPFNKSTPVDVRQQTPRAGFWWSMALSLVGLLLFVLAFNLFGPVLGQGMGSAGRIALGLLMAAAPAALWLTFFLVLDRRDPEPKQLVIRTLLAGALVYAALATPVLHGLFAIDEWLYATSWSRLLGGVLVVGVLEQVVVYIAVRYTIYERPEFNERVDGVIYCVAAGLGVATVMNFSYVVARGGVDLDIGSVRVVINTLAYGAIAGLFGYFVGQARFERVPLWYLPAALSISALLSGLLFFVLEGRGGGLVPSGRWIDLALAAVVAVLAVATVFALVARAGSDLSSEAPRSATPRTRRVVPPAPVYAPAPIAASQEPREVVAEVDPEQDESQRADPDDLPPNAAEANDRGALG